MLKRSLVLVLIALFVVGCSGSVVVPPEEVHRQFIAAVQQNDRQAALALTGEIMLKEGMVDRWLGEGAALQRESPFVGNFIRVETLPPSDVGKGKHAISVWKRERGDTCYRTELAQTEAGWKVIEWVWMGMGGCPTS